MGYTARLIAGDTIVLHAQAIPTFVDIVKRWEEGEHYLEAWDKTQWRNDHLSWCRKIDDYDHTVSGMVDLFADYGFEVEGMTDGVYLWGWQGDKLGSSWYDLWSILAHVAQPTDKAEWYFVGEDGSMFAEVIEANAHRTVTATLKMSEEEAR